jgi:uncharacterized LabA/DUF88 family protein
VPRECLKRPPPASSVAFLLLWAARAQLATNVYVDAFNLYYGCLKGTPYRWLDLGALCARLLPNERIHRIRYFTTRVIARPDNPGAARRQQVYLRALATVPRLSLHYGHHLSHVARMPLANPHPGGPRTVEVVKTEEKGSDVNLATFLLLDAFKRECDVVVVMSNDSDLKLPIEVTQSELGLRVGVINPHPPARRSRALHPTFFKQIRASTLAACQFPPVLKDAGGAIHKPKRW